MPSKPTYQELEKELQKLRQELNQKEKESQHEGLIFQSLENHMPEMPLGIVGWDLDFKVIFWNKSAENIFGYKREEILNIRADEIIIPKEVMPLVAQIWEQIKNGKGGSHSVNINRTKDNRIITCSWYNAPIIDDDGNTTGVISIVTDISAQLKTEEQLLKQNQKFSELNKEYKQQNIELLKQIKAREASEQYFRRLLQSANEGFWLIDRNKITTELNEAMCEILGRNEEEILGKSIFDFVDEENRKIFEYNMKVRATGKSSAYEIGLKRPDGKNIACMISGTPMHDEEGNTIGAFAMVTDISEWKQAQLKIEESENKFRLVFENAGYGILFGNREGIILDTNPRFCEMTGYTKEELMNKSVEFVFSEKVLKQKPLRFDLLETGESVINERELLAKDGENIFIEMNSKKLDENHYISLFNDLTLRKKAEEALILTNKELKVAKEKAEESDRLKSEFLTNLSHEVRTPLNGIMGFARVLGDPNVDAEKRKAFVDIIENSSIQLVRIIDDILEIAQLETGQVKVFERTFCVNDMLDEILYLYEKRIQEKGLSILLKKGMNSLESTISSDESKVNKVLSHLVDNAIRYTNQGSVEIGYRLHGKNLMFYVKDTGIGIEPAQQSHIFERFAQGEKGLSRRYGGLGLGLAIAREVVELLGGGIRLKSEKERGSVFSFTIPYKAVYSKEEIMRITLGDKSRREKGMEPYHVLVAEDEEVNFLYLQALLEIFDLNIEIIHAANGQEAVDIMQQNTNIDLILMDLKMPVMDGFEATRRIRENHQFIPIIVQSAYTTGDITDKARNVGCSSFITKPIPKEVLESVIYKYLEIG